MSKRLTAREQRNPDAEIARQKNSSVGSSLQEFLFGPRSIYETALGAGSYAGSPAQCEDRTEAQRKAK